MLWARAAERPQTDHCVCFADEMLRDAAEEFTGDLMQVPPMYSAVKVIQATIALEVWGAVPEVLGMSQGTSRAFV